jgi:hypothetical protein
MTDRIGALHLNYRVRGSDAVGAALAPRLDRAVQAGLGEAVEGRLAAMFAGDPAVIVIRELRAAATIGPADLALDSRVTDALGRAAADAVAAILSRPPSADTHVRFADQAEFVGSFILDLIDGTAWDRWYYGAFHRHRGPDTAATIASVLDDNRTEVSAVFAWLSQRGRLDEVLATLGPSEAHRLAAGPEPETGASSAIRQVEPLLEAGFQIAHVLGWSPDSGARTALVARYMEGTPIPPTWSDRRSLSAWVLGFVRFVVSELTRGGSAPGAFDRDALHALLTGRLDWLEFTWIEPLLMELSATALPALAPSRPAQGVLTARHERALERLADLVRRGRLALGPRESRESIVVKLLAALSERDGGPERLDRALVLVIEQIAEAFIDTAEGRASTNDLQPERRTQSGSGDRQSSSLPRPASIERVRAAGPSAVAVLQQIARSLPATEGGVLSTGAPLFLLTRALLDVRLHSLTRTAGVPFEPLRAVLAQQWLGLGPPFDNPTAVWVGELSPSLAALDSSPAQIADLAASLVSLLRDQRALVAVPPDEELALDAARLRNDVGCSERAAFICARIAWMVMRAWSRWLPGIGSSSPTFLVRNCLQRRGRVMAGEREIAVHLEPAPFDVVLEMAGYYSPIDLVPWLGGRRVTFTVGRRGAR